MITYRGKTYASWAEAAEAARARNCQLRRRLVNGSERDKGMLPTFECLCPECHETTAATCISAGNEIFICAKCLKRFTLNIPDWAPQEKKDAYRVAVAATASWAEAEAAAAKAATKAAAVAEAAAQALRKEDKMITYHGKEYASCCALRDSGDFVPRPEPEAKPQASSPPPAIPLERREHNLYGGILYGVEGLPIELQARYMGPEREGKAWNINITGMAGGAVREVTSRIAGAFAKFGLHPLAGEILINLAPAGVPKFGTSLDLPIAMIALQAAGYAPDMPTEKEKSYFFFGETSLHGDVRRIRGALPIALCAPTGATLIVPEGNQKECCCIRGIPGREGNHISIAGNLEEVLNFMRGKGTLRNAMSENHKFEPLLAESTDFAAVKGQERAKRAMLIAAAGGHNVLMVGPPGEGKTLLASALPGILPPLTNTEKIELTRLYSAKGLLHEDGLVVTRRPFRSVHHTVSKQALVGGGSGVPEPGEITLAHFGVLFMDELAEFSHATLESLRQPVESGSITVSRVDGSMTFPCRFTLIAAMNPCPCGFNGEYVCEDCLEIAYDPKSGCSHCGKSHLKARCQCSPAKVESYRKKISGPILDRIDLHVEMKPLSMEEKFGDTLSANSQRLSEQVREAREMQRERFAGTSITYNAAIPGGELSKWCVFEPEAFNRYRSAIAHGMYSTRATDRMAKIARTIADLDRSGKIDEKHIDEAAGFLKDSPLARG